MLVSRQCLFDLFVLVYKLRDGERTESEHLSTTRLFFKSNKVYEKCLISKTDYLFSKLVTPDKNGSVYIKITANSPIDFPPNTQYYPL